MRQCATQPTALIQQYAHRRGHRYPQREALRDTPAQIVDRQPVVAFRAVVTRAGDQGGELSVCDAMGRQQYELDTFGQQKLGPDDESDTTLLRFDMRPHDARQ